MKAHFYCAMGVIKDITHIVSNLLLLMYQKVTGIATNVSIRQQASNIVWFVETKEAKIL